MSVISIENISLAWHLSLLGISLAISLAWDKITKEEISFEPQVFIAPPQPEAARTIISEALLRTEPPRKVKIVELLPGSLSRVGVAFYCDESVCRLAERLRRRDMDVVSSADASMDGKSDSEQLLRAQRDRRILITSRTKEFEKLAGEIPHSGILLCPPGPEFEQEIIRICYKLVDGATAT